jgi:phosphoribosylaminoimidazole carboxylase (NCAIR synthetase)
MNEVKVTEESKITTENEINTSLVENRQTDEEWKLYLEQEGDEIRKILVMTVYSAGRILKKVKDRAEKENRNFVEAVVGMGISPGCARGYIHYFIECEKYPGKLDGLPLELVLEFRKEDTPKLLSEKVLNGEITKLKQLKELKKEINLLKPENENLQSEIEKLKKDNHVMYQNMDKIIEAKEQLELKIEHSDTRNLAEFKAIFIDIARLISEKLPLAKHYLSKIDIETAQKERLVAVDEINRILSLLN